MRDAPSTMSDTQLAPAATPTTTTSPTPVLDDEDDDRLAHIGRKEDVARAYVTGETIIALCGHQFVPTRDPDRYPVCPRCKAVLEQIRAARGGAN